MAGLAVRVLGSFAAYSGERSVLLSEGPSRLVAFLALNRGRWRRGYIAGQLWPELPEPRALANLRNSMWRLSGGLEGILTASSQDVGLSEVVTTDLDDALVLAKGLVSGEEIVDLDAGCTNLLSRELLPGWYDDWLLFERARLKQLFLHALERLATRLASQGRWAEALDAGLTAVALEPLRETAHRTVFGIHLAEGNFAEARRQFEAFRTLLQEELGAVPSALFVAEAASVRGTGTRRVGAKVSRRPSPRTSTRAIV